MVNIRKVEGNPDTKPIKPFALKIKYPLNASI